MKKISMHAAGWWRCKMRIKCCFNDPGETDKEWQLMISEMSKIPSFYGSHQEFRFRFNILFRGPHIAWTHSFLNIFRIMLTTIIFNGSQFPIIEDHQILISLYDLASSRGCTFNLYILYQFSVHTKMGVALKWKDWIEASLKLLEVQ